MGVCEKREVRVLRGIKGDDWNFGDAVVMIVFAGVSRSSFVINL